MAQKRKDEKGPASISIMLDAETYALVKEMAKAEHMATKWFIVRLLEKHIEDKNQTERSAQVG